MARLKKQEIDINPLPIGLSSLGWLGLLLQGALRFCHATKSPVRIGIFVAFGRFIWIERSEHASEIYHAGFFGKGTLSRSEPTWYHRVKDASTYLSPEQITAERRRQRREGKREKTIPIPSASLHSTEIDNNDTWESSELLDMTEDRDVERLHLDLCEAFFLAFAIGALEIRDLSQNLMSADDCWTLFGRTYSSPRTFAAYYAVYHYYRSLGWVPKDGAKFGVHFVLYQSGPKFRHAEFAVIVIHGEEEEEQRSWRWLLGVNRICTQVKKTLVLCHVMIPDNFQSAPDLEKYQVREVILKRWSPEKNRD